MKAHSLLSLLVIFAAAACVDRITFDIGSTAKALAVDGFISDEPGPYKILINSAFDIESKLSIKTPISAQRVIISDDQGNSEVLKETSSGEYQTKADGMRGTVGRTYTLRIELRDGRIYESIPDTLHPGGILDSIYFDFKSQPTETGTKYGFDVLFNSSAGENNNFRFLWKFVGTFRADTNPELKIQNMSDFEPCDFNVTCSQCNPCNYVPICSGLRNISKFPDKLRANLVRMEPCSCCTCWYNIFNDAPVLSDSRLLRAGDLNGITIKYIPVDQWIFQHKVYASVRQMSLSQQTFDFYEAIKSQKLAVNSLFQPVTGKIPSNFVQLSGAQIPIEGLFFATGASSKAVYITREDVPKTVIIPDTKDFPWRESCLKLFPNSTTTKPVFWED